MNTFETVIGLEVHLQLRTKTKIFCGCANIFGEKPNTQTCPVCLGLPGSLPVLNRQALYDGMKVAMALNCSVNPCIKFDRKNYYYPDLPKGYQISQYDLPIANGGYLTVKTGKQEKKITIRRVHLEEDAGKLIHEEALNSSLVDYNRTGAPLMEIVSEPDLRSPQEAYDYLTVLKLTLQYLDVSDCDMEKGSLRCDANISLRRSSEQSLGMKTEVKNMNSFKAVKSALEFEKNRQRKLLESNQRIVQETRLWNEPQGITMAMRSKEEAHDYRYFPEPDLVPFVVQSSIIEQIKKSLPELPAQKFLRLCKEYSLSDYDAQILVSGRDLSIFFEECAGDYGQIKKIANWIIGPLRQELNARKKEITEVTLAAKDFVSLIAQVEEGAVSHLTAKDVLGIMIETGKTPDKIIAANALAQVSDQGVLEDIVQKVIEENASVAAQIKQGKESAVGFLVGQSMRKSQGKGNPKIIGEIIKRRLQNV